MLKLGIIKTRFLLVAAISFTAFFDTLAQPNKIESQGNVGIGTLNPSAPLEVAGSYNGFTQGRNAIVLRNNGMTPNISNSIVFVGNDKKVWEVTNDLGAQGSNDFYIASYIPSLKVPFYINGSGYIGIGNTNPVSNLHVNGTTILTNPFGNNYDENLRLPPSNNGDFSCIALGAVAGASGTGPGQWSIIRQPASKNYIFSVRYISEDYFNILPNGNMGIGTTTPDAKLSVNGNIHAREVKVDLNGWPDYVFKKTYPLATLDELKAYIEKNQHLPDMPSEADVKQNGVNLGEIVKLQTKKIEELTLYLIEKDKRDKEKDTRIQSQQEQLQIQQQQIDQLKQQQESLIKALESHSR